MAGVETKSVAVWKKTFITCTNFNLFGFCLQSTVLVSMKIPQVRTGKHVFVGKPFKEKIIGICSSWLDCKSLYSH